jgi:hypothetical protein
MTTTAISGGAVADEGLARAPAAAVAGARVPRLESHPQIGEPQ